MTAVDRDADRRALLSRALHRYRSRLLLVGVVRNGAMAITFTLGLAAATSLLWMPDVKMAIAVTAALVMLAALVAIVVATLQAPNLAKTAALVDQKLGSNDCLVTAVECLDASDAVADLVVREATRRLEGVTPAAIAPIELPRRLAAVAATVAALVVGAAVTRNWSHDRTPTPATAGRSTPSTDRSSASARGGQRGSAVNPQDASSAASAAARVVPGAPDQNAERSRAAGDSTPADRSGAEAGRRAATGRSNVTATATSRPTGGANDSVRSSNPTDRTADAAAGGPQSAGAAARGDRAAASGAQSGSGGSGRSTALASRTARGAGGVSGGSLSNAPATDRSGAPQSPRSAAAIDQAAWTRAQAAIARERIPADLRQLVQDYFTALRRARR